MKIQSQGDYGLNPVGTATGQPGCQRQAAASGGAAEVSLTPQGRELQRLTQHIGNLPEPISPRAAEVKRQIDAGTYAVSGSTVAATVIKRLQVGYPLMGQ